MWTALLTGTTPWLVVLATLTLAVAAAVLIVLLVRATDGEMSVHLRWLGLHVHRKTTTSTRPHR
jgi:hypothetical protein